MNRPLVALPVLALACRGACADEVSFKGKTITMVVGYAAGGGTDLSGRLIASLLGRHLPGEPAVVADGDVEAWMKKLGGTPPAALDFIAEMMRRQGAKLE